VLLIIPINISPLRWGHPPKAIDMLFGVLSDVPDVITNAKFCVNRLGGFLAAALPKVPFPILIRTTLTTVLRCRADCDTLYSNNHAITYWRVSGGSRSLFSFKSHVRTEPYKPVKTQEAIQMSKLPDAQPVDKGHVRPIERDDWPSPPAPAAACPEICMLSVLSIT